MIADIIIPLRLQNFYSYYVPHNLEEKIEVGMRVLVQFGSRKSYYGIVARLQNREPKEKLKPIQDLPDGEILVTPEEIFLWEWASEYYMAPIGSLLSASLPCSFLPSSDTEITLNKDYGECYHRYREITEQIISELKSCRGFKCKLVLLQKKLGTESISEVGRMLKSGLLQTTENLNTRAPVLGTPVVSLAPEYMSEKVVQSLLTGLKRTRAQKALVERLLFLLCSQEEGTHSSISAEPYKRSIPVEVLTEQDSNRKIALRHLLQRGILQQTFLSEAAKKRCLMPGNTSQQFEETKIALPQQTDRPYVLITSSVQAQQEVILKYTQSIQRMGKNILILYPASYPFSTAADMEHLIRKQCEIHPILYNAQTPDRQKVELRTRLLHGEKGIAVLGTRTAVLLPVHLFDLVVVCDEEDPNYKQGDPEPRFNARDYLVVACRKYQKHLLLCSITPSTEVQLRLSTGQYYSLSPVLSSSKKESISLSIIDLVEERKKRSLSPEHLITVPLRNVLRETINRGESVAIVINRKGYAPLITCSACGYTFHCPQCDVALVFHKRENKLQCHYCGYSHPIPQSCPSCKKGSSSSGSSLKILGFGIERIEDELLQILPNCRICVIDPGMMYKESEREKISQSFLNNQPTVFVGTRLMAYLRAIPRLGLMAVLNMEQLMAGSDFRSSETGFAFVRRFAQNYPQLPIVLQCNKINHPILNILCSGDVEQFAMHELSIRQLLNFPPYVRLINLYVKGAVEMEVEYICTQLQQRLHVVESGIQVQGPIKPLVSWIRLKHIRYLCLRIGLKTNWKEVRKYILHTIEEVKQQIPPAKKMQIYCDVDPR